MKRRDENPTEWAGCYSLDLYCDHTNDAHRFDEFPHQFVGAGFGECAGKARDRGWILHRNYTATCPKCTGRVAKEGGR